MPGPLLRCGFSSGGTTESFPSGHTSPQEMKAGVSVLQAARAARSACVNTRCWCVILAASTTGMTEPHDAEMAAMPFNARVHQVFGVPYIKQEFHKQARKQLPQFPQE